jgi:glutathione S-transferase
MRGDIYTEEFTKINPFQTVPAIVHGDYNLWESVAIVTYLSETYNIDNSLYPKDLKIRGRINAFLHWHHQGIREPCIDYLVGKIVGPKYLGRQEMTEEQEAKVKERFNQMLDDLKWVLSETRYVARTNHYTIADFFVYNELSVVVLLKMLCLDDHPEIKAWYEEIGENPCIKELTDECIKFIVNI